jgi:hypothetical protein
MVILTCTLRITAPAGIDDTLKRRALRRVAPHMFPARPPEVSQESTMSTLFGPTRPAIK